MAAAGVGKRRRSKKSKKSWRKFTDIRDVEEFLEEQRKDERTGGPASEKADKDLYFVGKETGSEDARPKRKRDKLKSLRCEANLLPPPVKKPVSRKRRKGGKDERVEGEKAQKMESDGQNVSDSHEERTNEYADSSDEEGYEYDSRYAQIRGQEAAAVSAIVEKRTRNPKLYSTMRDLWADSLEPKDIPDDHYLRVTRKKPIKKPGSLKEKPSLLESVEAPPPGASYNPTFEDHQDLLRSAVSVEEKKLRAEEKLEKKLRLTPMDHHQRERVWLEEMTEGLLGSGDEEEEGDEGEEETEGEGVTKRPVRAEDRKLRRQRRKERERREEERRKATEKAEKMRMSDVYRLKAIKQDIVREEEEIAEKDRRRLETEREAPYRTRRLGKHVYEDPDIDVQLSSEVAGSLRSLKPEGSIAMDRFKSLQKRNVIEPRKLVRPFRKYKLKVKEKRTARLPEEGPVY